MGWVAIFDLDGGLHTPLCTTLPLSTFEAIVQDSMMFWNGQPTHWEGFERYFTWEFFFLHELNNGNIRRGGGVNLPDPPYACMYKGSCHRLKLDRIIGNVLKSVFHLLCPLTQKRKGKYSTCGIINPFFCCTWITYRYYWEGNMKGWVILLSIERTYTVPYVKREEAV